MKRMELMAKGAVENRPRTDTNIYTGQKAAAQT
jgi:hypothetical protein